MLHWLKNANLKFSLQEIMQEFVEHSDIFTVDALYYQPELAAIHLVRDGDQIALIDTGTQYSTPQVAAALESMKLDFSAVKLIILTHIHLDHAGGAGALMARCPNAQLVVHPRGARHMIDPSKLIAGSIAVYGEREFNRLYGEISPVEESRLIVPNDGDAISMGQREFVFVDTPGHASHHFCIFERNSNSAFTGDTLGIAYRALREPDHAFVMPTTTPVQFNPEALHASIDRVMSEQPQWLYYTHYSVLQPNAQNIAGLHEQIDDYVMLTQNAAADKDNFESRLSESLLDYLQRRAQNELPNISAEVVTQWVRLDADLNAQGLVFWWQHRRKN